MNTFEAALGLLEGIWWALTLVVFFWMLFTGRITLRRLRRDGWPWF